MTTLNTQALAGKTQAELIAMVQALAAKAHAPRTLTMKISEKGALSVYGMGRWPVTLYRTQWERLIAFIPEIETFIAANVDHLAVKE